jgi:hypothetical protein
MNIARYWSLAVLLTVCSVNALAGEQIDPSDFPPPAVRLTSNPAASERPRVALDPQGFAIVVWQDGRYGNREILWQKFDLSALRRPMWSF